MIVATSPFSRTLLWFFLLSLGLWPAAAFGQLALDDLTGERPLPPAGEQVLPLTGEQALPPAAEPTPALTETQALVRIRAALGAGDGDAALDLIDGFLDQSASPAFIESFTILQAAALEAQGRDSQAIVTLEQFLEEFPGSRLAHEARLRLGALYTALQQPGRAIPILSRVLDLTPDQTLRAEALSRLCLAYEANGEPLRAVHAALTHADQAGAAVQRDLRDYLRGLILHRMDDQALGGVLDAFSSTYPGDLALIRFIELHLSRGDETLAERDLRTFLHRFPGHAYAPAATALLQTAVAGLKAHRHVIAAVLPFSGPMKPFGTEAFNGIRLALDETETLWGSRAVGLVVEDSVRPAGRLRRELSSLLYDFSPIALIGPLLAREVQLLGDAPDLAGVPFITPTATLPDVKRFGRYWFSTAMTPSLQIDRLVDYAMRQFGYSRFCILAPRTPHGRRLHDLFHQAVARNGGEVIAAEGYAPRTTDASLQIIRIKETDLSLYGEMVPLTPEEPVGPESSPIREEPPPKDGQEDEEVPLVYTPGFDALFLPGHPTDVAFLAAQLAFFDVNVPLLGTNTWNHPNLLKWGRSSIEGGVFGDALFLDTVDPDVRRFIAAYRDRFQADPSIFAVQAYDAMRVVLDTIHRGATTGADVRMQLFVRHNLPTLGGLEKFDEGGILTRKVYMIQVQHGRFVQLD
ncbi:MAG: ABC transporter substrate-binding protein [Nitrospira sp.]|nr:ABC transporter substrate-binding protein [Nitrospira sp.]